MKEKVIFLHIFFLKELSGNIDELKLKQCTIYNIYNICLYCKKNVINKSE